MATYGYDDALNKVEVKDKATTDSELAGKVPTSRTINGKALTGDITLDADDVGALGEIKAGAGISIGDDGVTIGHSNSVKGRSVGTATNIPILTVDDQGHITEISSAIVYPPTTKGTANQYWRSDGDGTGAWTTPSSLPVNTDEKLISSKAVYEALQNYAKQTDLESVQTLVEQAKTKADESYTLAYGKQDPITVDGALDGASTNPIQNKVVNQAIYNLGVQLRSEMAGLGGATIVSNVSASSWSSNSTYSGYGYRCAIAISGVTASDVAEVVFSLVDATSGNYAPVCETYAGGVYVYSKVNTAITIPTIVVTKG